VINVQFITGTTNDALSPITPPHFEFYGGWYYSTPFWLQRNRTLQVFLSLDCFKSEFEY
jgi:hypothetical protein